ncbi:MAG: hypothetical protein BRD30_11605 [Bacteroidetes bacterium QH_2_63_10]|nr:MAG: hypothetical protein BRD30_11605 [Bacteroidetes bacterium QH_2_63_10]
MTVDPTTAPRIVRRSGEVGNMGYWVQSRATGREVATTAVQLVARTGFEEGGLRRLECLLSVHHEASQRVAEKAGAQREGLLRRCLRVRGRVDDAFLCGMLPDDLTAMDNQRWPRTDPDAPSHVFVSNLCWRIRPRCEPCLIPLHLIRRILVATA